MTSAADVDLQWGLQIPLRDGIRLNATLYRPGRMTDGLPVILTMTPYVSQLWHDFACYFAAHGYAFIAVDVRGRGNSEGLFDPNLQEGPDAYDVIEWIAAQSFCNGKVAMWGGSYAGYAQWAAVKQRSAHLMTIAPVAAPHPGVDTPMRNNIARTDLMQWITLVSGRTLQDRLFFNCNAFWAAKFRQWFESGLSFGELDTFLGNPSEIFQRWTAHPHLDDYWDSFNPTAEQYARLDIPILTITGCFDGDQLGALMHYRRHLEYASPEARKTHYLVMGPWDHFGTRSPKLDFCGLSVGPASLVDLQKLHVDWYAWTLHGGPKPEFLRKNVAYYVMEADEWRYADSLDAATAFERPLYLYSRDNPTDVFNSGSLLPSCQASGPDTYVYDPRDVSGAQLESREDSQDRTDQSAVMVGTGKHLVYHSASFDQDSEITGFFRFSTWLAIDQPDTDFRASVYEIDSSGRSLLLADDYIRARYREDLRREKLIDSTEPLRYDFNRFTFISRRIRKGNRLRLVVGPVNSIYAQKNYNSGGIVSEESIADARTVTVRLYHDESRRSVLYVPIGVSES